MRNSAKNILWVFGGDIFRRLIGFLTVIIIARRGGIEGFGMYSIAFTVLTYGLMLSSGGLHLFGVRESASGREENIAGTIAGARLVMSFFLFVATIAIAVMLPNVLQRNIIIVVAITLFPNAAFLDWYFQGRERMGFVVLTRAVSAVVYCAVIYFLVRGESSILWVGAGMIVGDTLAAVMFLYRFIREGHAFKLELHPGQWWPLVRTSFPLGLGTILGAMSVNFPPLAIGALMTAGDVGIYSAAAKLVIVLLVADRVIGQVFIPATARIYATEPERFSEELVRAIKWVVLITLPVAVGGTLLADKIIDLVFGMQFRDAIPIFRIAVWYFPVTLLHTIYTAGLIAIHAERIYGRVMMLSALLYIGLTVAGILTFGILGAAAGVVVAETVTMIAMRAAFRQWVTMPLPKGLLRICVASLVMGGTVFCLPNLNLFLILALGIGVYTVLLFATRAITTAELSALVRHP